MEAPIRLLVLANRTADSEELHRLLRERHERGPIRVTLLAPATWEVQDPHGGRESARRRLSGALERLRTAGIEVEGRLGDPDPMAAFVEIWGPGRFDEVVVSTLPTRISRWLQIDLPHRIERAAGVPVTHVIASAEPALRA